MIVTIAKINSLSNKKAIDSKCSQNYDLDATKSSITQYISISAHKCPTLNNVCK